MNVISSQTRGRGQGQGCGRGRNPQYHDFYDSNSSNSHKNKASLHHQKSSNTEAKQENGKCIQDKPSKNHENNCYRCSMKGQRTHTCCMPKHLTNLYQASMKEK